MNCKFCKVTFAPFVKAFIGLREFDTIEIKTKCPSCGQVFYIFTPPGIHWASEKDAIQFSRNSRNSRTKTSR